MKKTYMIPSVEVTTVTPATIIANSPFTFDDGNGTGSGTVTDEDAEGEALVKGRGASNVWDDDWSR